MRHKSSWTDCFPLEIYWTWIVALLVAGGLLLFTECQPKEAHAEAYLDVAGGFSRFMVTAPDGDYLQKDLPHSLDLSSVAYKVGLGWRFNERWSVQGGYVNLGTVKNNAVFVPDSSYDAKAGKCIPGCPGMANYKITDAYHGGELTITRSFHPSKDWAVDVKAGGALLMHRFTITRLDGALAVNQHYGRIPAAVVGLGLSYKWAYLETDLYHGIGPANCYNGCGYPLANVITVAWAGVKVPLTF